MRCAEETCRQGSPAASPAHSAVAGLASWSAPCQAKLWSKLRNFGISPESGDHHRVAQTALGSAFKSLIEISKMALQPEGINIYSCCSHCLSQPEVDGLSDTARRYISDPLYDQGRACHACRGMSKLSSFLAILAACSAKPVQKALARESLQNLCRLFLTGKCFILW